MTDTAISFADACLDPNLFGDVFTGPTWANWRVIDKAIFGLPLDENELRVFHGLTGRTEAPEAQAEEVWLVIGRRGGKNVKSAALCTYLSTIGVEAYGWRKKLVEGETGVVQLLAVDRDQAGIAFGYIRGFFRKPIFRKMVTRITSDSIELNNGFAVEVTTADQRRVRGRTVVAAVYDEVAFWRSENSTSPDIDVHRAVKPAMATMPGAMVIAISSPYARRGLLWKRYQKYYGKPGKVLVVQAPTWIMNPAITRDGNLVSEAYADDPESASAEFGAEFRSDLESLINIEAVQACVVDGVFERPPERLHSYVAFTDPSGGSADSMTLAIAHKEGDTAILDLIREIKPPFSPEAAVAEFAEVMKRYRISTVYGDRYGAEWVAEAFRKQSINYQHSERVKSAIYLDMLPLLNSRGVDLLDDDRLTRQLTSLERRVGRGTGRDIVDHPKGMHDDVANAVAGAVTLAALSSPSNPATARAWKFKPRMVA
ncbi:hypothetical protein FNL56_16325 [Tardiphaga sp. vice304]|uniref:hypothetical protein n=1 Tax=Tardiphaga sp. vice304 TaxID=2592817 RepID=UPI0011644773|nr:hypothetical protein [Tardiphaga sp. vice304]QDM27512.1 hypothetical protein FNL56_16325 [Tardiphaga sp. vice304]